MATAWGNTAGTSDAFSSKRQSKDASIDETRCNDENDIDGDDDNYDDDEKVAWEETRRKDDDWRREVKVVH